jgi:exonuclease III
MEREGPGVAGQVLMIISLNINGLSSPARIDMLHQFIYRQETDIILLQEVTCMEALQPRGYVAHVNIGMEMRGTAILVKEGMQLEWAERTPTGRAIATMYRDTLIVNVYAPSGTSQHAAREAFYNLELPPLLRPEAQHIVIGGDFNCVLQPGDVTGHYRPSRALRELIEGLHLQETWTQNAVRPRYTHYYSEGVSRIDRIYMTPDLAALTSGIRIVQVAFTDHCAVELRVNFPNHNPPRRQKFWRLNPGILKDQEVWRRLKLEWAEWAKRRHYYAVIAQWWGRCVKRRLKTFFVKVMVEQRADHRVMENHLYACIYDILNGTAPHEEKLCQLNKYKAKLVQLHTKKIHWILLDQVEGDVAYDEQLSLYHVVQQKKRGARRQVLRMVDEQGNMVTDKTDICDRFADFYARKYETIPSDHERAKQLIQLVRAEARSEELEYLDAPITESELAAAARKGATHTAPGVDGIGYGFYKSLWGVIQTDLLDLLNCMFLGQRVTPAQKHGIIIPLLKGNAPVMPEGFRQITLMTTEYKLLARVMAARLQPLLRQRLARTQFCGVPDNTILDAVAQVRDAMGYSESTWWPLCVMSLDFQWAFNQISHRYLFAVLPAYGITTFFSDRIRSLYEDATAAVRVNGRESRAFNL